MVGGTSDVIVKFGADLTELSAGFKKAQTDAESSSGGIGKSFATMGPMATQAGTALTGGLTVPIMAIAAFAMKSASDVNGALRSITRETGLTGAAAVDMKEQFKAVASETPASLEDVGTAMTIMIQRTHLGGLALQDLTKQGLNMSRMMGTDVKGTITSVTTAFTAYGVEADSMGDEMDHLFVLFQKTGVPMDEVTAAMDKMAPTSRALGLTFDQTAATIAKFAEAGLPARQTVSMLTGFVTKMTAEGKNAGVEWKLMFERIKAGTQTKDDVALFGANWTKVSDAVKTGKFNIDDLTKAMNDGKGAINDTAKNTATFGERLTMLRNRLEIAFAPIGSAIFDALGQLLDALTPVLNFVTFLAEAFGKLPGPVKMVIIVIAGIAAAIGPVLMVIGTMMTALAPVLAFIAAQGGVMAILAGAVGSVATAFGTLLLLINPVTIAIAIAVAVFMLLYTQSASFRDLLGGVISKVQELFGWIMRFVGVLASGDLGKAGEMLKKGFEDAWNMITHIDWGQVLSKILAIGPEVRAGLANIFKPITDGIGSLMKIDYGGIFAGLLDSLSGVLDQALNFINTFDFEGAFKGIIDSIGKFFDSLFGGGDKGDAKGPDLGGQMSKSIDKAGPDIIGKLGNVLAKGFSLLPLLFTKAAAGLIAALGKVDWGSVALKLLDAIKGVLITIIAFLKTLPWVAWAVWLFEQIKTVLITIIAWLKTLPWLDYANTVWNALKLVLGTIVVWLISRPWGEWAIVVLQALLTALAGFGMWLIMQVVSIGSQIWGWIVGAVSGFGSWIIGQVAAIGSSIWNWIVGAVSTFGSWLIGQVVGIGSSIWSSIVGAVSGFGGYLIGQLSGLPGAITSAVTQGANAFGGAIVSSVNGVVESIKSALQTAVNAIGIHGSWHIPAIPVVLPNGYDITFAEGGIFSQPTFGIFGEAGREMLVPEKYFGMIAPELFNILPNPSGYTPPSAVKGSTMSIPSVGGRVSASTSSSVTNYNTYVTVDSEDIKRKVFEANREHEQYNQLLRGG